MSVRKFPDFQPNGSEMDRGLRKERASSMVLVFWPLQ